MTTVEATGEDVAPKNAQPWRERAGRVWAWCRDGTRRGAVAYGRAWARFAVVDLTHLDDGRAAVAYVLLRGLWPMLASTVQTTALCIWWRRVSDGMNRSLVQVPSTILVVWLAWSYGWTSVTVWLILPGLVPSLFRLGRRAYLHSSREARSVFQPEGWLTAPEHRRTLSADAGRRAAIDTSTVLRARVTLPGAAFPSPWRTAHLPVDDCAVFIGKMAIGPPWAESCFVPHKKTVGIFAGPQKLKSALMAIQLARFPYAALNTQTKTGTYWLTKDDRAEIGPVWLIDPEDLTGEGRKTPFRWLCQRGCRNEDRARALAEAFCTAARQLGEDGPWLASRAAKVLRAFLCIADIAGKTMADVHTWCTSVEDARAAESLMKEPRYRHQMPGGWIKAVSGALSNRADRTQGMIWMTLEEAVGFMGDSSAAALVLPDPNAPDDDGTFDVDAFLHDRGTVYMIATERPTDNVAPLLAAFASFVVEETKRIAQPLPKQRLREALGLFLDEAAKAIAMPLDVWLPDLGGRNIFCCYSAQSPSQLEQRYEKAGKDTVLQCTACKIFAGGLSVKEDLEHVSMLTGLRPDRRREGGYDVPVLTPDEVRRIPDWDAVVIHDASRATLVHVKKPWSRDSVIEQECEQAERDEQAGNDGLGQLEYAEVIETRLAAKIKELEGSKA